MTWITSAISAVRQRLGASASPASFQSKRRAGISGPVTPAVTRQRQDALKLYRRECLIADLKRLHKNDPRRGKLRREICSLTNEAMKWRSI